ncbi:MAG: pantetheine-phosphate adenylyltransferase [bacterium]|nr:pantetheine-phosphate adenylyltransferase [bacterium]
MKFNLVVCGGTFDHFHKGHVNFLRFVFSVGKKAIVGVTSDSYIKSDKRKATSEKLIESFEKRKEQILEFAKSEGVLDRVEIIEIDDLFGPTLSGDLEIDAIVVSEETKKGAETINQKRKELGLKELSILIAPQVLAEDGKMISSGRVRKGEISKKGKAYIKDEWLDKDLQLTQDLREEFQKPFGEIQADDRNLSKNENNLVITVGDVTAKKFNEKYLGQNISVIDFNVAREKKFSDIKELGFSGDEQIFTVNNPAGYISSYLFKKIAEIFKSDVRDKTILKVNGEEDLAVLPLILFSPLNTIIYYGQPNIGLVRLVVSEESKERAYNLVSRLKTM